MDQWQKHSDILCLSVESSQQSEGKTEYHHNEHVIIIKREEIAHVFPSVESCTMTFSVQETT